MMKAIPHTHKSVRRLLVGFLSVFAVLAASAVAQPATAADAKNVISSVIPRGSDAWSYYRGADVPASGWQNGAASWSTGTAPFGIGSGAGSLATTIKAGAGRALPAYFTKTFTLSSDLPEWSWINSWADDGIVVWVNGVEVGRKNAPDGTITATSHATVAPSSTNARKNPVSFSVPPSVLHEGQNTIAVQVLANWRGTPNLSFDAHLVREDVPASTPPPTPVVTPPPTPTVEPEPEPEPDPGTNTVGACGAQGKLAPACGALWGVYTINGRTLTSAVTDLESKVGRKFDVTMRYHDFSTTEVQGRFPDAAERTLGKDRTLLFAWQARVSDTNTNIAWSRIAGGEMDSFIDSAADRVKAYGEPVMIAFDPEFDNEPNSDKGSMADYVNAYRRIHDRFAAKGVSNVAWAWVSTGYLGAGNGARIMEAYPGDEYVDWIGYDPYNFYTCNGSGWASFEQKIADKYDFFVKQGLGDKPQLLSEYGTSFHGADPALAAKWHREIPAALKKYPNLKALVRFDSGGSLGSGEKCQLQIDNGSGMLSSFKDAGLDPHVNTRKG